MTRVSLSILCLSGALAVASCQRPDDGGATERRGDGDITGPGYTEKFVDVGGIRTRYLEGGQGEPLVLVHGGGFGDGVSADRWDRNIKELARHFRVFALDRIGQGFTDNPRRDEDYTVEAVIGHIHDFSRAVGLSRIHLVGSSRGGYLVARLALEQPELVETLIICNSATLAPETADPGRREQLVVEQAPTDVREAEIYRLKQLSYSAEHITEASMDLAMRLIQSPKGQQARTKREALREQIQRQKPETLARLRSGGLKVPTLLVWGHNDRSAITQNGLALFDTIAEGNPMTSMRIVNRAGHYVYREQPREFNRAVIDFIRAHQEAPLDRQARRTSDEN